MRAYFIDVDGIRTRYLAAGSGPALVLIQPVGYPTDCFVRNLDILGQTHTVIAPDVLGQGFTDGPREWNLPPQVMMASHVGLLLDQLSIDTFSIAGSSLGGLVAALLCLQRPTAIQNLIIIGSGTVFNEPISQPAVLKQVFANGSIALSDPTAEMCRKRMRGTCYHEVQADDIVLTQMIAYALPGAFENYKAIMSGLIASIADPAASVYPHLSKINNRALIMVGEKDIRTSLDSHRKGAARMGSAHLFSIPDCGHLPFLEMPEVFNTVVARFLAGEDVGDRPKFGEDRR
jgi:2-hydroxy-6-oxonona-2,4-dienedioate hydrolase